MGLDSVTTEPQPAPTGNGRDVTDMVLDDLKVRREAGTKKYGTSLRTNNGRNPLVDAYQETLDLALYLRQAIEDIRHTNASCLTTSNKIREIAKWLGLETSDDISLLNIISDNVKFNNRDSSRPDTAKRPTVAELKWLQVDGRLQSIEETLEKYAKRYPVEGV